MSVNSNEQAEVGELDNLEDLNSIQDFTPIGTPLTVPYFEVYRTDELYYQEYVSPYLNQSSAQSNNDSEDEPKSNDSSNPEDGSLPNSSSESD